MNIWLATLNRALKQAALSRHFYLLLIDSLRQLEG